MINGGFALAFGTSRYGTNHWDDVEVSCSGRTDVLVILSSD
jgi:hypothetical protein